MATDNNLGLVNDVYAAYAQGNTQFILDHVIEDVDWIHDGPSSIPYSGVFRGRKEVPRFFQALATTLDNPQLTLEEWVAQGEKVVTTGRFTATVKATGTSLDVPVAHVFTLRNGKIVRWFGYTDTAGVVEAFRASGQSSAA